uniref:Uncharacterized protein n=1 Tax=Panagrolaimus sp. JU765 TaxID=591449 RepID=A0AC34QNR1_9BILA
MLKEFVPILVFLLILPLIHGQGPSPETPTTTPVPTAKTAESCCPGFVFDRNMDFCYFDMVDIKVRERGQYCAELNGVYDPNTRRCFKFPMIEDENPSFYQNI